MTPGKAPKRGPAKDKTAAPGASGSGKGGQSDESGLTATMLQGTDVGLELFAAMPLEDALMLVAMPGVGSAAIIAAQYLVKHLNLPLVGHFRIPEFRSIVSIQDGQATSPVRIFGGETVCRVGGPCPRVFVVMADVPLHPVHAGRIAEFALKVAKSAGARLVLSLDAVVRLDSDSHADVYSASSEEPVLRMLVKAGIPAMARALISGPTAQVLVQGKDMEVASGALLVEAAKDHPDGLAASALIAAVSRLLPDVPVDPKPLEDEAMQLEAEIKRAQSGAGTNLPVTDSFI
ncbi:MAG TPA: PAC2 family protein [Candidatus Thermoplasmatota archaeon]|nr:PAC2 family protein [Candidatus Thermoplasmatota archaeon]